MLRPLLMIHGLAFYRFFGGFDDFFNGDAEFFEADLCRRLYAAPLALNAGL